MASPSPSFLFFLFISCKTGADSQDVYVTNTHSATIMVDIWNLESSNTVDPNPAVSVDEISFLQIKSMESLTISKSDIKGNSGAQQIRLFLYEVKGDFAFYQSSFSFSFSQEINIRHGIDGYFVD